MGNNTIISVEHLNKIYSASSGEVEALKNIDFEINKGEVYGIIGLSGAGKSTLVRTINLLEKPTSGRVVVNGKDLNTLKEKELRKERAKIGMIFQHFNLLMQKTVLDNVMFPLRIAGVDKATAKKKALELLKVVGLEEKAKSYPGQLSGGQKQRVAIARVLSTDPDIILSDEATSALDPQTTASILELLKQLNKERGITIVVITHEMAVIQKICDKVAVLEDGVLVEKGDVSDIFRNPKTEAAKRFVYSGINQMDEMTGKRTVRVIFDGKSAYEPIIGNLTLKYGTPVNILYANTHAINGNAEGEMVLQLPEDNDLASRMFEDLLANNLAIEEVTGYVG